MQTNVCNECFFQAEKTSFSERIFSICESVRRYALLSMNQNVHVPTDDAEVRAALRRLGHPITFFGEDAYDRRSRLKQLLQSLVSSSSSASSSSSSSSSSSAIEQPVHVGSVLHSNATSSQVAADADESTNEPYFTEGPLHLRDFRLAIAEASRQRAQKRRSINPPSTPSNYAQSFCLTHSVVAADRPLSAMAVLHEQHAVITGSTDGSLSVFTFPQMEPHSSLTVSSGPDKHLLRCCGIQPVDDHGIVCGWGDGSLSWHSWESPEKRIDCAPHKQRIARIAVHPHRVQNSVLLFATSHDSTWSFNVLRSEGAAWETLYVQPGHVAGCHGLAVHPDGSLLASADLQGVVRVWDLRTGRSILALRAHVDACHSLAWSGHGRALCSGGADGLIHVWDVRNVEAEEPIHSWAAHSGAVSTLHAHGDSGETLVSGGLDGSIKVWDAVRGGCVQSWKAHDKMVSEIQCTPTSIVSVGWDRTMKLFAN